MTWLSWLLHMVQHHQPIDQEQIREELTRDDPEFSRVRGAQHDAFQVLAAKEIADGLALRDERQFWSNARTKDDPEKKPDDG
jgi:hypothetical protein